MPKADGERAFVFLTSASSEATLADRACEVVGHFWWRGFWNQPLTENQSV